MDTHHVELPVSRAEAVRRAVEHVVAGDDAVLCVGFDAGAVLDNVSDVLAERRLRVLRCSASGQGGLSLSGLLAQITGRPDLGSHDDEVLQRGFQALTTHGEDCDGVVLLIEGAQALQRSALRYLQFIGRTTPGPRFVLASEGGEPDLYDVGLTFLRTRLAAMPVLVVVGGVGGVPLLPGTASAAGSVVGPVPVPVVTPHLVPPALSRAWLDAVPLPLAAPPVNLVPATAPVPAKGVLAMPADIGGHAGPVPAATPGVRQRTGRRAVAAWVGVGAAMAACVALGVAIGRHGFAEDSSAAQQSAFQMPTPVPADLDQSGAPAAAVPVAGNPPNAAADAGPAPVAAVASPVPAPLPANGAAIQAGTAGLRAAALANAPPVQAEGAGLDDPARRPAPRRAASASADTAPARAKATQARDFEPHVREAAAASRDPIPPRPPRRAAQASDTRERRGAEDGRQASYALPVQPAFPAPFAGGTGERRPIIGTFTTDQSGVRVFRFAE